MPEFLDRLTHEGAIASRLSTALDTARVQAEQSGRVNWDQLATDARQVMSDELRTVYIVIFLMMLDDDVLKNRQTHAETLGERWARRQGIDLATYLTGNMRRELQAGESPEVVFNPRRAEVLAATEVTRAITRAETDARRTSHSERRAEAGQGPAEQTPPEVTPPLVVGDGLIATWHTREDGRVCSTCHPLNEQPESVWAGEFPSGPPAHPNCRCFLTYEPAEIESESLG